VAGAPQCIRQVTPARRGVCRKLPRPRGGPGLSFSLGPSGDPV